MDYDALIDKKLSGQQWTKSDIQQLITSITNNELSQLRLGAVLMLIKNKGMSTEEVSYLAGCMATSGEVLHWPDGIKQLVVDKHSTGGVGDKVSLSLLPTVACFGAKVPMVSGRALGHTGGTIDKAECVPGFRTDLSTQQMLQAVTGGVGAFLASQTERMVPADRIMYSARTQTCTVASVPLIATSILSKKLAEGVSALLMDIKCGGAAFMTDLAQARELAIAIRDTGKAFGLPTQCLITKMDHPLGRCVGNAVEVAETLQILNGKGQAQLSNLIVEQSVRLLQLAGKAPAAAAVRASWADGRALRVLQNIFQQQGVSSELAASLCCQGDFSVEQYLGIMGHVPDCVTEVQSCYSGYISEIIAKSIATFVSQISHTANKFYPSSGIELLISVGEQVGIGQKWVRVFSSAELTESQKQQLNNCLVFTDSAPSYTADASLILEIVE